MLVHCRINYSWCLLYSCIGQLHWPLKPYYQSSRSSGEKFISHEWMNKWMSEWLTDWEIGWVQVGLLWDKEHKTHIVRNSTLRLQKFWSLVLIGSILNKIQPLKNLKIYKRCMDCCTHHLDVYIFLSKFWSFWMAVSRSI